MLPPSWTLLPLTAMRMSFLMPNDAIYEPTTKTYPYGTVSTGINTAVIEHLKKLSVKKDMKDKFCGLVFDEIALKRRLFLDVSTDKVEGFEDFCLEAGCGSQLADHALVFMLQGIRAKFKQPVAFYFVKGTVSSQKLAVLIKEIITVIESTGFNILTTICDQGPTNMEALKLLKSGLYNLI
ncbi:hypothetical protein HF086_014394 [Spodoptera exigua]|uniref:Transposable element P transposase-like RNase H domain-containing protein n=1 Tax=Spodoptera exigua TaxID=7107 RepID=A0A922MUJ4_SPOEX|nr:hypothetical protein HF086_014394 [Spodoptera exigua]